MLTFGRFVVSLFLLVCLFVVAWSFKFTPGPDQPANSNANSIDQQESLASQDGSPAPTRWPSAQNGDAGNSGGSEKTGKGRSLWNSPESNPTHIAIVDPLVSDPKKPETRNVDIPDRIKPDDVSKEFRYDNTPLNSDFANKMPEPPPLVGDSVDADEKTDPGFPIDQSLTEIQKTKKPDHPEIPKLIQAQEGFQSTGNKIDSNSNRNWSTAKNGWPSNSRGSGPDLIGQDSKDQPVSAEPMKPSNDWTDPDWKDPNAPPLPEGYSQPVQDPKIAETTSVLEKKHRQQFETKLAEKHLPAKKPAPFQAESGSLMVVKRGDYEQRKTVRSPIGYIKHVSQANDSLPALAEKYLGDRSQYMEIYRANAKQLKSPTAIPQGTVLRIPVY